LESLRPLLEQHGLSLVFANVLLTQLGLPLPAMPMLIVAGALMAEGTISPLALALAVLAGSLLGDIPWYFAGRRFGYKVLRTLCRISIEPDSCVKQTENIFLRFGAPSLVVAKYIPGFSTVAPPLAGTMRLGLGPFLAYSAAGALVWAAAPVAGGALFRGQVEWLLTRLADMGTGALILIALVVAFYVGIKATERYLLIRFLRMVRISVDELRDLMRQGPAPLILDARSAFAREAEPRRIPGAISVELGSIDQVFDSVPPDRDVVVYCS
jgi:membrane protein DedA with SNARE-associated domain